MATIEQEVERAAKYVETKITYVETKIENLGDKIKEAIAEGMSYDILVMKDGKELNEVPIAVASILAGISLLPPARLLAMLGIAGATLSGYTFKLRKKPVEPAEKK